MAAEGGGMNIESVPGGISFKSSDFGLNEMDLQDMNYEEEEGDSSDEEEEDDELDPIEAERKRRARMRRTTRMKGCSACRVDDSLRI